MPDDPENQEETEDQETTEDQGEPIPETYEAWLEEQPEPIKVLLDEHVKGLKSALEAERGSRKELEKKVRELAAKADKGSELERKLTETADILQESDKRADFYEEAHLAGVGNLKLAWVVIGQDQLLDRYGKPDLMQLKERYPELFRSAKASPPPAHAGTGTGTPPPQKAGMNEFIRRGAGH